MTHTMTLLLGLGFLLVAIVAKDLDFSDAAVPDSDPVTAPVTAAPDRTAPTVSMAGPGAPVQKRIGVTAAATDADSGVASVEIQYLAPATSTWVTVCTDTTTPYRCTWNTEAGPDGGYHLRARAVDGAGRTTGSDPVPATVANAGTAPAAESGTADERL